MHLQHITKSSKVLGTLLENHVYKLTCDNSSLLQASGEDLSHFSYINKINNANYSLKKKRNGNQ